MPVRETVLPRRRGATSPGGHVTRRLLASGPGARHLAVRIPRG
ncbi:hypothetical protein DWUX_1265 [Desulfovibrio diazotrophicus]|nr:hypothetical protein DWUX_1265 [Desulfovibrio diazotrophicus]